MRLVLVGILFLFSFAAMAADQMHLISVNGVAETSIDPNMVQLQIESWSRAKTSQAAQETQAAQFKKINTVIDKYKIKKDDFKSDGFSVYPDYTYEPKTQRSKVTGYRVSHTIHITLRKIEDVGALVDELTSSGKDDTAAGVSIQSVMWDSDKKSATESAITADAVHNARADAESLAKAAGVKIKAVHRISHTSVEAPPPMLMNMKARAQFSSLESDKPAPMTELSPAKIKVRTEVQMEFEI